VLLEICLQQKFERFNDNTIVSKDVYRRLLQEIRQTGIAYDRGERYQDTHAIAVPIANSEGPPRVAVVIAGPAFRLNDQFLKSVVMPLRQTADKISKLLFY